MVVVRCSRHGVDAVLNRLPADADEVVLVALLPPLSTQFMMLLWLRSVAERRNGDTE